MDSHDNDQSMQTPPSSSFSSSQTLPRNFELQPPPRTPEPVQQSEADLPPLVPPDPPRVRILRRRRQNDNLLLPAQYAMPPKRSFSYDIPAIRLSKSEEPQETERAVTRGLSQSGFLTPTRLQSPAPSEGHHSEPPHTPINQIVPDDSFMSNNVKTDWASYLRSNYGDGIKSPVGSVYSELSDSSVASTISTTRSFTSLDDPLTSPESDAADPFVSSSSATSLQRQPLGSLRGAFSLGSPMRISHSGRRRKAKTLSSADWTQEMDDHLWLVYNNYLSDPKVTPFKTLPGSSPPLGVCHRVAREAKRLWLKKARSSSFSYGEVRPSLTVDDIAASFSSNRKPEDDVEMTLPGFSSTAPATWPRSASATRKRLRYLCKTKAEISPHYQRLAESRSSSPVDESSSSVVPSSSTDLPQSSSTVLPQSSSSAGESSASFATRDLSINLATSTAETMQPGNPLAKLASEPNLSTHDDGEDHHPISRGNVHQKSRSLQLELGLGVSAQAARALQLASPFQPNRHTWGSIRSGFNKTSDRDDATIRKYDEMEIHHPRPLSGSQKRRAEFQLGEEGPSDGANIASWEEKLLGAGRRRRVRSRGFSVGEYGSAQPSSQALTDLFTPPTTDPAGRSPGLGAIRNISATEPNLLRSPLPDDAGTVRRLGSPFTPAPAQQQDHRRGLSNTYPRSLFSEGLDSLKPSDQTNSGPFSFGEGSSSGK